MIHSHVLANIIGDNQAEVNTSQNSHLPLIVSVCVVFYSQNNKNTSALLLHKTVEIYEP